MSRKHCRRRIVVPLPPRGLRPKLSAGQVRDLALVHVVNLDAIARGEADAGMLWDLAGAVLTWWRVAELCGLGMPEMAVQLRLVEQLIERYKRTGRVGFSGPDYQMAKVGLEVMDQLARVVDKPTAIAAAEWSEAEINRRAAAVAVRQEHATC